MAADKWRCYNKWKEYMSDGAVDIDADTFKCALYLSTSNAATLSVGTGIKADLTNEHANANGYTTGGLTLTTTWVESSGTVTFDDTSNPVWTASGGSIIARFAVIYDDSTTTPVDVLVAYCLMDNTPADVTVTDTNTLTINMHASGVFTVSGGDTA